MQARLRLRGSDQREYSICLDRELADGGNEGVEIFDGSNCTSMPDFELEFDKVYEAHVALDREAGTIAFGIDGQEVATDIGQPVYQPSEHQKRIQLSHDGAVGQAVGFVSAIGTDGDLQEFSVSPLFAGPYRPLFDLEQGQADLTVSEGQARFEATSPVDDSKRLGLTVFGTSNRIEGVIELSSESVVVDGDDSFSQMRLGGTFYNDTAEGGFNDTEGNVFAGITLKATPDGVLELFYCLFRSNTADFSDSTELVMQDGTECGNFGITPTLDTPHSVSIVTDLQVGTITFTANEVERVHTITTAAFEPNAASQFISAQARAGAGSSVVGFLDDFRTSADAPLVAGSADSSSSGGGCSIASGRGSDLFLLLVPLAALFIGFRRNSRRITPVA